MNPLELLKALEAIRDKAAHACADITATTNRQDMAVYRRNTNEVWATKYIAPFDIHAIAHAACEAAYADMEAEGAAGDIRAEGHPV